MMPNNNWINFPKDPYDGQVFYYPPTEDCFTYIATFQKKLEKDNGLWLLIKIFLNLTRLLLIDRSLPYLEILQPFP